MSLPMSRRRNIPSARKPTFYIADILRWADEYHDKTGRWPVAKSSGRVASQGGLTWVAIDAALSKGCRGLPGGTTLAKLLVESRGYRHHLQAPRLTVRLIIKWAEAHRRRTADWPTKLSGPVADAPGETWSGVDRALHVANRGIKKKTSLAKILAHYRGRQHSHELPHLKSGQVLE